MPSKSEHLINKIAAHAHFFICTRVSKVTLNHDSFEACFFSVGDSLRPSPSSSCLSSRCSRLRRYMLSDWGCCWQRNTCRIYCTEKLFQTTLVHQSRRGKHYFRQTTISRTIAMLKFITDEWKCVLKSRKTFWCLKWFRRVLTFHCCICWRKETEWNKAEKYK